MGDAYGIDAPSVSLSRPLARAPEALALVRMLAIAPDGSTSANRERIALRFSMPRFLMLLAARAGTRAAVFSSSLLRWGPRRINAHQHCVISLTQS